MDETEKKTAKADENRLTTADLIGFLREISLILAVVLLLFTFVFRLVRVSGPSMFDTLVDGDSLLLLNNTFYSEPKQGDIVVVYLDEFRGGEAIIKRVIATEGQTVDIDFDRSIVYVNGEAIDEPYVNTPTNRSEGVAFPIVVKKGTVFLMGDNRNSSLDSRSPEIGLVDKRSIVGKAMLLLVPGTDGGTVKADFTRIGSVYHE